ncbi:MAG: alanine--tRNA ligase [Patescibacteria group bacterium]|nr:alanine--tRNA ligase [Patescibacteria group bacterium]
MKHTSSDIRKKFLEFWETKQHSIIPSSSLVPENDPSVLFNTAGMQPLVPYLLGETHPSGTRLSNAQKCIRTTDLDEVGDDTHLTFFEMLGNWSLGDYFKEESIKWSWEFLTDPKWLGLDPNMIAVTVFEGDESAPRDEQAAAIWKLVGMPEDRISYLGADDNWWAAGDTGPCGPDTEIFYWVGQGKPIPGSNVGNDEHNWMEIWNNVFMEYKRNKDGSLEALPAQNVDTGMGLERITATLNGVKSAYDTDIFQGMLSKITDITGVKYPENIFINELNFHSEDELIQRAKSMRIVADHVRTSVLLISDGVLPSNMDQGYILRRILRRAIREMHKLGFTDTCLTDIAQVSITHFENIYPLVGEKSQHILEEIFKEEEKFQKTITSGLREFDKLLSGFEKAFEHTGRKTTEISGKQSFKLYDTYGFPIEMTVELAAEHGLSVDTDAFEKAFAEHQEKSRSASEGKFKGGLADDGEETTNLHTATHLLLAGLREVLGDHVHQAGSNITPERLRFDFNHGDKLTDEQKQAVEAYVNEAIQSGAPQLLEEMDKNEAKESGVEGSFWEKYPDTVKVYSFTDSTGKCWTKELCGGPHAEKLSDLGIFKIKKEQSSSSGIRRIKAVLEK